MPDAAATAPSQESAEAALAYLAEMSPDLRGAAILGSDGEVLAASAGKPGERWHEDATALFAAADAAEGVPVEQIHIATEQGEVFAIRNEGLAAVAVTDRFALASLLLFDLRSMLRELRRDEMSPSASRRDDKSSIDGQIGPSAAEDGQIGPSAEGDADAG
jgi:predicted regulator of Ras-like GTPase activity (Roadblock/LC7/MglB family)